MSESPNKLIRFWQELKRRRVFSVMTAYAATGYIIIEVTNNLVSPLHLPTWIPTLVILLLIAGLPAAIILSWIFDFTPQGIKKTESLEELESKEIVTKPAKRKLRASYVLNAVLIIAVIVLAYPKIFKRNTIERLRSSGKRISVAVMPFQNMTNDTLWNVWQDGIQMNLITSLSDNPEELKVRQSESISSIIQSNGLTNYAYITPSVARNISQKLDADVFINGSINQSGLTIRLNAQLVDSKTEDVLKPFQIDGAAKNILHLIDSLSVMLKSYLIISNLEKEVGQAVITGIYTKRVTNSPEAYRYFIYGNNAFQQDRDYTTARNWYLKAIAIDSNFFSATNFLVATYYNQGMYDEMKKWCQKLYIKKDQMPLLQQLMINDMHALLFETPYEVIKWETQILRFDDQQPITYYLLGLRYNSINQYNKAIPEFEKALEIYNRWESKPWWVYNYTLLGFAYHETKQYRKEKKLYKKAERDFPNDATLIYHQAVLDLSEGKIKDADEYIEKYKSVRKEQAATDAVITTNLASLYWQGQVLDKAEEYYRKALSLEPDNPARMNNLGWFLIDTNRNIKEGLEVNDKALELSPDNHFYLDCKGWGLYKQGKYEEALKIIEKSWELRPVYRHEAFLHLEAAKKAIANQKSN